MRSRSVVSNYGPPRPNYPTACKVVQAEAEKEGEATSMEVGYLYSGKKE